jgi:hypothetical protein
MFIIDLLLQNGGNMQNNINVDDPIKILLDKKTFQTLKDDALFFGFASEHQLSKKVLFLSFQTFQRQYESKKESLNNTLRNVIYDDDVRSKAIHSSLKVILHSIDTTQQNDSKSNITLRFNKTDKEIFMPILDYYTSSGIIDLITLSQYLRTFLHQYARLSRIERELIIFKKNYDSIQKILKKKLQINLQTKDNTIITIKPYKFIYFGDECHFLIGDHVSSEHTFGIRLSKILDISHHGDIKFKDISDHTKALVKTYEESNFKYKELSNGLDTDDVLYKLISLQKEANI